MPEILFVIVFQQEFVGKIKDESNYTMNEKFF